MDENQKIESQEEVVDTDTTPTSEVEAETEEAETEQAVSFTQEQVNEIVKDRLERQKNKFYSKYGVEDKKGFDDLIGKGQAYETLIKELAETRKNNGNLTQELAFLRNNINPNKYEDIKTFFKGEGKDFSEEELIELLKDRPEWLNEVKKEEPTTTIAKLGVENKPKLAETEDEKIKRLFGV